MDYARLPLDEIVEAFKYVTRQRISQIVLKYQAKGDQVTINKLMLAKRQLKKLKLATKRRRLSDDDKLDKYVWNIWKRVSKDAVEEWQDYNVFFDWAVAQTGFGKEGWVLSKRVLLKRNTEYSPATCAFVPTRLTHSVARYSGVRKRGGIPVGVVKVAKRYGAVLNVDCKHTVLGYYDTPEQAFAVYKQAKEANIRRLAELYKDEIDPRVYAALMAWTVEITD
jgi:hypothetical protein